MSTIVGIVCGFGLLVIAVALEGGYLVFINPTAMMIVLGGTLAATFISFPFERVARFSSLVAHLFTGGESSRLEETIEQLVELGHKASEETIYGLEEASRTEEDRYIRMGLQMLIQSAPLERIARRFAVEMESARIRHQEGVQLFGFMARVAPSFGLVGTLIGLINMLRGVGSDLTPETLGPSMAVALVTTLYGAVLAFLFFAPAAEKLKAYSGQEQLLITVVRDATIMIGEGRSSRELEEMLNSYLPPSKRQSIVEQLMLSKVRSA